VAHDKPEANRLRQQRHRDRKRAVTLAAKDVGAAQTLGVMGQCTKCSGATPCAEHQAERERMLANFKLTLGRGSNLARKEIITGGYSPAKVEKALAPTNERTDHGRSTTHGFVDSDNDQSIPFKQHSQGRYTNRVGTKDQLQLAVEMSGSMNMKRRPRTLNEQRRLRWQNFVNTFYLRLKHMGVVAGSPASRALWEKYCRGERI
jgi:hypothetical protein